MGKLKEEYGFEDFEDYNIESQENGEYTNAKGGLVNGGFVEDSQKHSGRVPINK